MKKYLVGIDGGTTGCKSCVFDFEGNCLGSDYREYPCYYPAPGRVEQLAEDMLPALFATCKQAIENSGVDPEEIAAMGFSSQGSVIGLLDENGDPIRPFVGWQDIRTPKEDIAAFLEKLGAEHYYDVTGAVGPNFSSCKFLWLKEHEPENWAKTALFSTQQDYFLKQFGADGYYTDLSSASREGTCDVDHDCWSEEIHELLGIPLSKRAKIVTDPGHVVGTIGKEVSEKTGLPVGCKICVGAHDMNCNTLGCGGTDDGTAVMVIGTLGSCFIISDSPIRDPNRKLIVKGNHGMGNWTIEAMSPTAASSFRWYRDTFGDLESAAAKTCKQNVYNLLTGEMAGVPIGSRGVVFLPYLMGAAGSHPNPNARGAFIGMDLSTTKDCMARAVLEGISFEMADIVRAEEAAGITVNTIRLTGGAANSPLWCQMLADITKKKILIPAAKESGCLGAAMYAGVGAGIYRDCRDAASRAVKIEREYTPNPENFAAYDAAFARWNSAYESLNGRFYK